ncbi:hypothetical protein RBY4I_3534 [Rhodobacterales bacterium Y4I]|nr:hypothetical protein RBY4I_3534 [Rhodobacterales bacterium Y4I]
MQRNLCAGPGVCKGTLQPRRGGVQAAAAPAPAGGEGKLRQAPPARGF